jgi:hypothetical protein
VEEALPRETDELREKHQARISLVCSNIESALKTMPICDPNQPERILIDRSVRAPYERYQDSKTPLNRILIRTGAHEPRDIADVCPL